MRKETLQDPSARRLLGIASSSVSNEIGSERALRPWRKTRGGWARLDRAQPWKCEEKNSRCLLRHLRRLSVRIYLSFFRVCVGRICRGGGSFGVQSRLFTFTPPSTHPSTSRSKRQPPSATPPHLLQSAVLSWLQRSGSRDHTLSIHKCPENTTPTPAEAALKDITARWKLSESKCGRICAA